MGVGTGGSGEAEAPPLLRNHQNSVQSTTPWFILTFLIKYLWRMEEITITVHTVAPQLQYCFLPHCKWINLKEFQLLIRGSKSHQLPLNKFLYLNVVIYIIHHCIGSWRFIVTLKPMVFNFTIFRIPTSLNTHWVRALLPLCWDFWTGGAKNSLQLGHWKQHRRFYEPKVLLPTEYSSQQHEDNPWG